MDPSPLPPTEPENTRPGRRGATAAACVITVVLLLAVTLGARAMFSRLLHGAGTDAYRSYDVTQDIRAVAVQTAACDVYVYPAGEGVCTISYSGSADCAPDIRAEDGVLTIAETDSRRWFQRLFPGNGGASQLYVYLPEAEYESLSVTTVSGDIDLAAEAALGEAALSSTSGDIWLSGGTAESLRLDTVSGEAYLTGLAAGALTAGTISGDLVLSNVLVSGDMSLTSVSGDIDVYDSDAGSLEVSTTSGEVTLALLSPKNYDARSTTGNVRVPVPDRSAGACLVTTVSGDIWIYED